MCLTDRIIAVAAGRLPSAIGRDRRRLLHLIERAETERDWIERLSDLYEIDRPLGPGKAEGHRQ